MAGGGEAANSNLTGLSKIFNGQTLRGRANVSVMQQLKFLNNLFKYNTKNFDCDSCSDLLKYSIFCININSTPENYWIIWTYKILLFRCLDIRAALIYNVGINY